MYLVQKLCRPGLIVLLILAALPVIRAESLGWSLAIGIEPTALFPNAMPLRQLAVLDVTNSTSQAVRCVARITLGGMDIEKDLEFDAAPGPSEHQIAIPDIGSPQPLEVEIDDLTSHALLTKCQQEWEPQRHWKIFVTRSSHEDIGYENYVYLKQADIADYIDRACALNALSGTNGPASYVYTMESGYFMRCYIAERSLTGWRDLVDNYVKTGRLALMGATDLSHTHWMDYEELARMNYWGRREMKDRFGLDMKTFLMVDNPSVSWSAGQAIADSGFKYIARYGQPWRTGGNNDYKTTGLPAVFWWVGPDTRTKILFSWRNHYRQPVWYGQDDPYYKKYQGDPGPQLSRLLKDIEAGQMLGPYPYDALLDPDYSDHEHPDFDAEALQKWHNKYLYPDIEITSPTKFFEYVEQNFKNDVPTRSGDLNNFSADYATIDPESQGWKREAARILPLAEGIDAISSLFDPNAGALGRSFDDGYLSLIDYDEHCWPTQPRPNDFQVFNSQYVKKNGARRALDLADELLDKSFDSLLKEIPNPDGTRVVVFNPLAHPRTDLARLPHGDVEVFDTATGMTIPSEMVSNNLTLFVASNVPAFGYKVYGVRSKSAALTASKVLKVGKQSLENQYYRIEFNPQTGTIQSIWDKEMQHELVNTNLGYQFNQMVYVHKKSRESLKGSEYSPAYGVLAPGEAGTVEASFSTEIDDNTTGAHIDQKVVLYDGLKRIDIINELSHVRALFSTNWNDRYKDNIYYAFPLNIDSCQFRVEYPGGVVRPYDDQLRWGSHDFLYANHWVNAGNDQLSVTMSPSEAGTLDFGEIRYNQFSVDYKPQRPVLFSYAYANRMAGLLSMGPADCNATFHYSFTSDSGDWRAGKATEFGWQIANPLQTRILSTANNGSLPADQVSFVHLNAPNVQLVDIKQSESPGRGWIIRLVETEGKDTSVTMKIAGFPISKAMRCNLVEDDLEPLQCMSNQVDVLAQKFSYTTIRVIAPEPVPMGDVSNVRAEGISDKSIRLSWDPPATEPFAYDVFRSTDPRDPPTVYNLIARTSATEFVDDWLSIDTPYYYYVAPVTRFNNQGDLSKQVSAKTLSENRSPPAQVQDLGVVRRSPNLLIIYWGKSSEPDVAKYYVYRSLDGHFDTNSLPIATVQASRHFLQTYQDNQIAPDTVYYYRVLAEDVAGNRQDVSPVVGVRSPNVLFQSAE
jgi:hypothetical protein